MSEFALVIHQETPEVREERLGRILTFFGVPWDSLGLADLAGSTAFVTHPDYAVIASVETLAAALARPAGSAALRKAAVIYAFASEDRALSQHALEAVLGGPRWRLHAAPGGPVGVEITDDFPELTGPMSGLQVTVDLTAQDSVLVPGPGEPSPRDRVVMSASGHPIFLASELHGGPLFVCASASVVDIDEPVRGNYYDVKGHLAAAVPLVTFLTHAFAPVMWRPRELGACLIIDDPLLKERYGACDFTHLRDLMARHGFTTNIAFIPWNWRRTSAGGSAFFNRERARFSVSVHGCDHTASEFGTTAVDALDRKAKLAQARMNKHQARTSIEHDPVMVFPQGVFSSTCPEVLKRNGFVAAVNTEVSPVDGNGPATRVRDVWDVAIMSYGDFPIYTRRYASHGIENFAFDLLLGKPCFIVAHHDFFNDRGARIVELVTRLSQLNCTLHWRSPREVIRRAYRHRIVNGNEEIEMYGNELSIPGPRSTGGTIRVQKRDSNNALVSAVRLDGRDIPWRTASGFIEFPATPSLGREGLSSVLYRSYEARTPKRPSLKYQMTVAARRLLSEFRDEYAQKMRFRTAS